MAELTTFQDAYPLNPWAAVTTNQKPPTYFPALYREFTRRATYNRFAKAEFNHNGPRSTELVITSLVMPHANHNPIGNRTMWLDSSHMDSFNRKITFKRYGGKMSLNRYDDLVTYWELDGVRGLNKIISAGFGYQMTHVMDKIARDAFLRSPFAMYRGDGSGASWNDIRNTDKFTSKLLQDIRLGLKERDNPIAVDENGGLGDDITCVTTPGVIYDLRQEAASTGQVNAWQEINRYTPEGRAAILRGVVGTYLGVIMQETNNACLFNCGVIKARGSVTSPIAAGDGAPEGAVDDLEYVGQPDAAHFIAVDDLTDFHVGDLVTIHVNTTNARGVTDGVDHTDGKLVNLRIVQINSAFAPATGAGTLSFERPIMEDFNVQIASGVYAYVTLGRNIHSMSFMYGNDGVAMGVAQPPTIRTPRPVDDLDMIQRISWDGYFGYQPFNKNAWEVAYVAGSNRLVGSTYIN